MISLENKEKMSEDNDTEMEDLNSIPYKNKIISFQKIGRNKL